MPFARVERDVNFVSFEFPGKVFVPFHRDHFMPARAERAFDAGGRLLAIEFVPLVPGFAFFVRRVLFQIVKERDGQALHLPPPPLPLRLPFPFPRGLVMSMSDSSGSSSRDSVSLTGNVV